MDDAFNIVEDEYRMTDPNCSDLSPYSTPMPNVEYKGR
jgi:hypothetical protein